MRMAKLQRTTLDPSKISGRCGRLMCCLRYEDATYRDLRKGLPNRGTRVAVGQAEGEVVSTDILAQRISVRMGDGQIVTVPVGDLRPPSAKEAPTPEQGSHPGKSPRPEKGPRPEKAPRSERGPRPEQGRSRAKRQRRSGGPSRRGRKKGGQK
ncbi:MAG: hypothetical protein ACYTFI_09400 [Planctomycetota bacterium]